MPFLGFGRRFFTTTDGSRGRTPVDGAAVARATEKMITLREQPAAATPALPLSPSLVGRRPPTVRPWSSK
jgi:hypothetical protein